MFIGARGWRYQHWNGVFYPDDLPDDWRLSYYSNEFDAVLVPNHYLDDMQAEDVEEWIDDSHEDFEFLVELDVDADLDRQIEVLSPLSAQLPGVILLSNYPLQNGLLAGLRQHFEPQTCFYHARPMPLGVAYNLRAIHEVEPDLTVQTDPNSLCMIKTYDYTPRQLRSLLEAQLKHEKLKHKENSKCSGVIVAGDQPDVELLRQLSNLYHLMA